MTYLDHAATAPLRPEALAAMTPFFCSANASGLYAAGREARAAIDRARGQIARALSVQPSEVYWTSGGSEADNWALFGVMRASGKKRHIVTTSIEHHAVLHACQALDSFGFDVTYVNPDGEGRVSPEAIEAAIRPDTALVSVMLANNEVGVLQPVEQIARIAHTHGALMHTDAVQAVGHIPVNMGALGADLLSLSGHKFGGPKGVGALIVRNGVRLTSLIYGGAQERGLRAGTENTPAIVGMGAALELAVREMDRENETIARMRDRLMEALLAGIPGARVNGSLTHRLPGNPHMTFPGEDTSLLLMQLDMAGIAASAGSACTSGAMERSHVLRAMSAPEGADLRLTLGAENTPQEIDQTAATLLRILKR